MAWKYLLYLACILPGAVTQDADPPITPLDNVPFLSPNDPIGLGGDGTDNAAATVGARAMSADTITLKAGIEQVNATHVHVSLNNPNPYDVSLLTWHSFLEEAAEFHSFSVQPASGGSELPPGEAAVRFIYDHERQQDSYMRVHAGDNVSVVFDITQAFKIPERGEYRVVLQNGFPGAQTNDTHPGGMSGSIKIESVPQVFTLDPSTRPQERRDDSDPLAGCSNKLQEIQWAINGTRQMAMDAYKNTNQTLVFEYFGISDNDSKTKAQVVHTLATTFRNLNNYNYRFDHTVSFNCDPDNNKSASCKNQTRGYYHYASKTITLCKSYFDGPAQLACAEPGPNRAAVQDRMSTIYHELTHHESIAPQKVVDFGDVFNPRNGCYNYHCATEFAKQRKSDMLPEKSAINLQQYAQALRRRNHPDWGCSHDPVIPGHDSAPAPPSEKEADAWAGDGACIGC